jgi:hypothetical protein
MVMTVPKYGRVTPLQWGMLSFGGDVLSRGGAAAPTNRDRLNVMKKARHLLTQRTGQDFGLDS